MGSQSCAPRGEHETKGAETYSLNVFTSRRNWRRWAGPRADLVVAAKLAAAELEEWSNTPSSLDIRIAYSTQLEEQSSDLDSLVTLHLTDLQRIEEIRVGIRPSRDVWHERRNEADERRWALRAEGQREQADKVAGPEPLMDAQVLVRASSSAREGLTIEVSGPNRTRVEGLASRLEAVLSRGVEGPTRIPGTPPWFGALIGLVPGFLTGWGVVRALDLAPVDNKYEWPEIVWPIVGAVVLAALLGCTAWSLPTLEVLADGQRSRFRTIRAFLWTGFLAVLLGVISSAVYAAL